MKSKSIASAYQSVKKFHEIAGVLDNPTYDTVDLYNSLAFEELSESITALEENNPVEILDGAIDEFYIVCGKLAILDKMGYNVEEGIRRVCENNLSKFPQQSESGSEAVFALDNRYTIEGRGIFNKTLKAFQVFTVYRDANGKIRKPEGFVPVDLSDCVPGGAV